MEIILDRDGKPVRCTKEMLEALSKPCVIRFDGKDVSKTTHTFQGGNVCLICGTSVVDMCSGGPIDCPGYMVVAAFTEDSS